ncbi:MAG: ADP-ribosylglycohydrolase family protein, partial [Myxococcota bacterium]
HDLLSFVAASMPPGQTRDGIERASELWATTTAQEVAAVLGSGNRVTAPDTIPFALWCASHHLDDFERAMWVTVSGLGDRDTTCAMVGGIVSMSVGCDGLPGDWLADREALPEGIV